MALHYDIWYILLSVVTTGISTFLALGFISHITRSAIQLNKPQQVAFAIFAGAGVLGCHLLMLNSTHHSIDHINAHALLAAWLCAISMAFCLTSIVTVNHASTRHFLIGCVCAGLFTLVLAYATHHTQASNGFIAIFATLVASVVITLMLMMTYWLKNYAGKHDIAIRAGLAALIALTLLGIHFLFYAAFPEPSLSSSALESLTVNATAFTVALTSLLLMCFMFLMLYERYGNNVFKLAGAFRPLPSNKLSKNNLSDALTKLPNRRAFESHLKAAEKRSDRNGYAFAVAFIDLDAFKPINDTHGHHVGDKVLTMTADRLSKAIRGCDFVARLGGDEFVAILEEITSEDDIRPVVSRIVSSIKAPYVIDHLNVELSCSVGIAIYPKDNQDNKLLVNADAAMYKAKDQGKNQFKFYDEEIESANVLIQNLQQDLMHAVKNKEFSIVYMPKINCKTMTAVGAEALVRWIHPTKGEILPNDFLNIAEQCGLIKDINDWVVEECCRTMVRAKAVDLNLNLSVNLSSYQFRDANLVQQMVEIINKYDLHPNRLSFEIKETAAIKNQTQFKALLNTFKESGIKVILDDFGLLPVSLTYLLDLDIDEIKIDKSFIAMINKDKDAKALIDAIFKLTHALGFHVTAEGIEDSDQQQAIIQLGCDFMQGYLFTKPVPEYDLLVLYKKMQHQQLQIDFDPPIPKPKKS